MSCKECARLRQELEELEEDYEALRKEDPVLKELQRMRVALEKEIEEKKRG